MKFNGITADFAVFYINLFSYRRIQQGRDIFPAVGAGIKMFQHKAILLKLNLQINSAEKEVVSLKDL